MREEKKISEIVPLEELLHDWQDKAVWGGQETKIHYLSKITALTEEVIIHGFDITAYKTGYRYHYSISIPGLNKEEEC